MRVAKCSIPTAAILLLMACHALAQAPAPIINPTGAAAQPAAPGGEMSVDGALDALDERGQNLKGFTAKVTLRETDEGTQLSSTRTGRVWFQKTAPPADKAGDDARIRVAFDTRYDEKRRTEAPDKIEYMLDKGWLTDRDYGKRIEVRRQVLRPGEKSNLLKLGQGPFPLPIGQKKEEVKKLFEVTRIKAEKGDPPGTVHLLLRPIKGTAFARKFAAIDVWMDAKSHFPRRIDTLDPKETTTRSTELNDVQVNPELGDADFALPKVPPDQWNIHEEPFSG